MAQQIINVGAAANDGTGDTLRGAFIKTDENFDELYTNRISGNGTDNYVPIFNGTNALENSQIFDDGSNIGIGTTSPSEKLDVNGNIELSGGGFKKLSSSGENIVSFNNISFDFGFANNSIISNPATSNTQFYINGSEIMRIDTSGNVGIGTTSPSEKLDVTGNINSSGFVKVGNSLDTASANNVGAIRYKDDDNNSYIDIVMKTGASTYEWVNIVQNNF